MEVQRFGRKRTWLLALVATVASVALVACGGDDNPDGGGGNASPTSTASSGVAGAGIDYASVSGSVRVDGSSTVFPISEAVAEEISKVSNIRADVAFSGTGGGFEKFCRGETQVSDASRPIKTSEVEACAANGITDIVEIQVAIDALTVMVNPQNDWVSCLNVEQLQNLFRAGGYNRWNDIDPSFPDAPISGFVPGTDSGTFDYFVEAIIDGGPMADAEHRGDFTASEDDNILARGLQSDSNAVGYFGFAYFLEAGQALKAVAVDGGDGCVEPSFEAALDGTYQPLSRPLFIYTTETLLAEDEAVRAFINFYVEHMQDLVPEVGYVTMPDDLYQQQVAKVAPFLQ